MHFDVEAEADSPDGRAREVYGYAVAKATRVCAIG